MYNEPKKWIPTIKKLLVEELMKRFGPYKTWGHKSYPNGKKEEYEKFCEDFALVVTIISGSDTPPSAIGNQLLIIGSSYSNLGCRSDVASYLAYVQYGFECGFLTTEDLPEKLIFRELKNGS